MMAYRAPLRVCGPSDVQMTAFGESWTEIRQENARSRRRVGKERRKLKVGRKMLTLSLDSSCLTQCYTVSAMKLMIRK